MDNVGISVGLSSDELLPSSTPRVSFQIILMVMLAIWVLVLQELLVHNMDSTQFFPWDPGGL